jgi:DNA phosphorothioation-dependent restriction protein DptG
MKLQELEQKEKELWKLLSDNEELMKPIKKEWSQLFDQIKKAKLREEVLREMGQDKQPR